MKILILGGTGAMGVHLVNLLADNDFKVFVTSRKFKDSENNVTYIQGNANEIHFFQSLMDKHWDVIVDFMLYTTDVFKQRLELILNATTQYVFLSSARVYANVEGLIKESTPRLLDISIDKEYLLTDEYALTKARQENLLKKSGYTNWTIIRPYITYSENRLQLGVLEKEDWLYRALQGRTIIFSEDIITKCTTLTYGLDVSKGIFKVIGKPNALGEAFHITSNESKTWGEILSIYLNVLEKHLRIKPKYKLQGLVDFLKHHHGEHQIIYDRIYNRKFDNSKIAEYTEINNFTEVEKGLEKCLLEFLKNPTFNRIDWVKEAIKDRETKEQASIKEIKNTKDKIKYLVYRYLLNKE